MDDIRAELMLKGVLSLQPGHRRAMLDLVMAWASIDAALGMLIAKLLDMPAAECAELIEGLKTGEKMNEIAKVLRGAPGGQDAAAKLRKYKKRYERLSQPRNHIAHSHCIGCFAGDTDYVVFQKFERVGPSDLAVYLVPVSEMRHATEWAGALRLLILRMVNSGDDLGGHGGAQG